MLLKITNPPLKLAAVSAIGVLLNIIGSQLAQAFNLDIYLDTFGTIFIAVLAGYVPGIAVGFVTNLINSGFAVNEMYFAFISGLVALFSAFFASKGYYDSFYKVLCTIPLIVMIASFFGVIIEELVNYSNWISSAEHFISHFTKNFLIELLDKSLAILSTFIALKALPKDTKEEFRRFGEMQAPLSDEIQAALKLNNPFILSLRTKIVIILIGSVILIAVFISFVSHFIYQESLKKDREQIAQGLVTMIVNEIDPKRVDEFIELGHHAEGYNEVEKKLYRIRDSNYDVKYIYVYKIMEDGCHVVFDLDTADVEGDPPGYVRPFDESFEEYLPDLLAGRPIKPIQNDDTFGYLLTIYKPVYNSIGQCVCYAGLDFSMEELNDYGNKFIAKVIAIFSGALIFILVLGLWFVENNIILPVNTMAFCARNFAYDSEAARKKNIELIKKLNIKTNDEIENLYSAFLKTTTDSMLYFENFKKAKVQAEVMHELAHKDAMTGLKNKTAYAETTAKLDKDIAAARAQFAIIMIDVNFLKRVNDTYGHEAGDAYLINAGKLACSVFGEEHVYRVGGDEFVAVFDGDDVARCDTLVSNLRGMINKFKDDDTLKPWEKISAAIGVAYYNELNDKTAEEVFKRADADMYKNKLAMKATRRD